MPAGRGIDAKNTLRTDCMCTTYKAYFTATCTKTPALGNRLPLPV